MALRQLQLLLSSPDVVAGPRSYRPRHALPPRAVRIARWLRFGSQWRARSRDAKARASARRS